MCCSRCCRSVWRTHFTWLILCVTLRMEHNIDRGIYCLTSYCMLLIHQCQVCIFLFWNPPNGFPCPFSITLCVKQTLLLRLYALFLHIILSPLPCSFQIMWKWQHNATDKIHKSSLPLLFSLQLRRYHDLKGNMAQIFCLNIRNSWNIQAQYTSHYTCGNCLVISFNISFSTSEYY